ncbi:LysR family transcriptional regulator [Clostridium sp. AM51-4]|jgi:DNA-binding transcriptional LysR family regulator|nr:LysR family transcriptional regulator [Clostridium sp. AM51-4]RHQ01770.1 LysR family transcriptional regulator [Clostridium sp. AM51-4]
MNLQQLYYFRKLAEVQHYTEAAKALYITQPSLSDSIASLEHELSVSLFQKKGRGVQLTKYGQEFYEYVNQALGILEHGIAAVREKSDSVTGTIDIGCIPTLLGDFLPNALDLYHEKCPQVSFNIFHEKSIPVAEGVSSGTYDIGLCSMVENKDDLVFVPITYQELVVIVRNDHPLAVHDSIELTALKGYMLSTYRDTIPIGKTISKILKEKGMEAVYSYDDEISIAGRINHSSKTAIVADTPFLKQFDNLKKIHLTDVPKDTRMLYLVYSKKNFITAAVEAFANFMVAHCLNLPPES